MNNLDVTFDLETCALCPTAAVMSLGAVVWDRNGNESPFFNSIDGKKMPVQFSKHVDLRSAFIDGFTIDAKTGEWWCRQSDSVKHALLQDDDVPLGSLKTVIESFFAWLNGIKEDLNAHNIYLWSQGSDFDIAILRNICHKYDLVLPVPYTNFRDHRTYFLEGARTICERAGSEFNPNEAYKMVDEYTGFGGAHEPIFDCKRSIYSTWQMMQIMKCFEK